MKRLVYERADGSIAVVVPSPEQNDLAQVKTIAEKNDPTLVGQFVGEVEADAFPDREFRNQWRKTGNSVHVDPTLETEERWKRIRRRRNKLLAETDGETTRNIEKSVKDSALEAYRQSLRDITKQGNPKNITWPEKP